MIVKLRVADPFSGMLAALKDFVSAGGATTVRRAVFVPLVPPLVEVAATLLLFAPAVVPVTFTEIVQLVPGARLAPLRLMDEDPSTAVAVPLHVLFKLPGVATTSPAGRLSVNATPFSVRFALLLLRWKVRLVVPFKGIVGSPNIFEIVGGLITVRLAEDVD